MRKEIFVPPATLVLALAITGCQAKMAQSPYGPKEEAWGKVIKENYSDWTPPPTVPPDRVEPVRNDGAGVVVSDTTETIEITPEAQPEAPQSVVAPETPQSAPAVSPAGEYQTYTVAPKDTLWGISKRFYGTGKYWRRILDANSDLIPDPKKLRIGLELKIPSEQ